MPAPTSPEAAARALSVRLFLATLATQESLAAYLGVKLGLYDALREHGQASADALAEHTGLDARYLREWLEQQAVCGLLAAEGTGERRVFRLPPGHERVLTASDDPLSLVSTALLPLGGVARALPDLLAAFASGGGVPDDVYGEDWRQGHGGANRAVFTRQLVPWLRRHVPDVHARLSAAPARVVDVGSGAGWASLALATAYPSARVVGLDVDAEAVAEANARAKEAGLAERVSFEVADAFAARGRVYDVVCLFDTLHEVPRPVEALAACRGMRAEGGAVLVMDARVADAFTAPGDEIERFQYATSLLHCLPAGRAAEDSAATGTVMRASHVEAMARAAGFTRVRSFDLTDRFHRLYRLDG
ncbi:class I SAM-dependent methyltransferase [Nonomuraea muscovyensis]|uniref:SAM-dependent methyltransferase n=1 Tax=Nonomuraea muscovyensis TaxID=1124761 RepID=A0A7X0C5E3_9ACTN|nr:class I SAM-dependent methyltransferase [Nonomuraea muscovyensis]MBB6347775.1 SAM-dependent methyltransferase [Nonomuraea muscovyensis]MDF2704693.1 Methyltransferase type 11 [Nonomuraea muscovyensis]